MILDVSRSWLKQLFVRESSVLTLTITLVSLYAMHPFLLMISLYLRLIKKLSSMHNLSAFLFLS